MYSVEQIWVNFSSRLHVFINQRISNTSDTDDILQEVFLKIHSKIDTLKDETKIQSWIYRIAQNTIIDYHRKQKGRFVNIDFLPLPDEQDEECIVRKNSSGNNIIPLSVEDNHEDAEQEIASGLKEMVKTLPEKYSQALLLVEFEGLSQIELSERLGISISGAKSRVQRGRQMLWDALMRCCHFEFDKYGTIIASHPIKCCCCNS